MDLHFIGWWILCILTCGLLVFYVLPYYTLSKANLYLALRNETFTLPSISEDERTKIGTEQSDFKNIDRLEDPKEEENNEWDF